MWKYPLDLPALEGENAALRKALTEQWEWNHAEHCSNVEWPHPDGKHCTWPLPVILGGDPNVYRTYAETPT